MLLKKRFVNVLCLKRATGFEGEEVPISTLEKEVGVCIAHQVFETSASEMCSDLVLPRSQAAILGS